MAAVGAFVLDRAFKGLVLVVLLLFGGKKIPELMRGAGKGVRAFKDGMKETTIDEEESSKNTKEQES